MSTRQAVHASLLASILLLSSVGVALGDDDDDRGRCSGKKKKGCEVPEVPYSAILPAATVAGAAGFYFVQRRRSLRVEVPVEGARDR